MLKAQREFATKAFYAAVGAPVITGRMLRDYGTKVVEFSNKWADEAQSQYDEFADEGKKVTTKLRDRNMVEELQSRMDLEKVQDRVEQLRDQLEGALSSWRESFTPEEAKKEPAAKEPAKTTAAKKAPAKKAPAKKAPAKTTAAKKAPAKKAPAKTTAAKKPATKAAAK